MADDRPRRYELTSIALIAGSMLMHEILLTRICALRLQFHFAYLVISNCLLALGAGGTFLVLRQQALGVQMRRSLLRVSLAYAAALLASYPAVLYWPLPHDLAYRHASHLLSLTVFNLLGAVPFFFGGIAVGMLLAFRSQHADRMYASDLFGAAVGCMAGPLLLRAFGAGGMFVLELAIALLACVVIGRDRIGSARAWGFGAAIVVGATFGVARLDQLMPVPTKTTELEWMPEDTRPKTVSRVWTSNSRIDLSLAPKGVPAFIFMTGKNSSPLTVPREWAYIAQDAAAGTVISNFSDAPAGAEFLRHTLYSATFRLARAPDVLIIGLGGGNDVWAAKAAGAAHVRAIELNGPIVDIHERRLRSFSRKLVDDPSVQLVVGEGRSELMRDPHEYDVIQMSGIDTWTALASGAYVLAENYLYTREAVASMYDRIKPGGYIQIARFASTMEALRLVANIDAAVHTGKSLERSIMVLATSDNMMAFMLKKGAFTAEEEESTRQFATDNGIEITYLPSHPRDSLLDRFIRSADRRAIIEAFPRNIEPTSDDRPYFFNFTRWQHPLASLEHVNDAPAVSQGNPFFVLTQLVLSIVLSVALILWPLRGKPLHTASWPYLVFFAGLGVGFMLVEIAIIQRLTLFLGEPVYSLTVTLFSLLVSTGLGSLLLSHRFAFRGRGILLVPCGILVYVALNAALHPWPLREFIGAALPVRLLLAVLMVAPLGLLLGVPFAFGLRVAAARDPWLPAWGWAINGCASVVGSILSVVISMNFGFNVVLCSAGVVYAIAFAALRARPA